MVVSGGNRTWCLLSIDCRAFSAISLFLSDLDNKKGIMIWIWFDLHSDLFSNSLLASLFLIQINPNLWIARPSQRGALCYGLYILRAASDAITIHVGLQFADALPSSVLPLRHTIGNKEKKYFKEKRQAKCATYEKRLGHKASQKLDQLICFL